MIGIEHGKYYVEYDDGDKHHNTIDQLRILKPPMYFGKLTFVPALSREKSHRGNTLEWKEWNIHFIFCFIFDTTNV